MSGPTMRQLRSWHRRLATAHSSAIAVSVEAEAIFGENDETAILLADPTIELHVALNVVEALISERAGKATDDAGGA